MSKAKSSRPFKVGERVAVYGGIPGTDDVTARGHRGTIEDVGIQGLDGDIAVLFDKCRDATLSEYSFSVFSQQCRRLAKPTRQVLYVPASHLQEVLDGLRGSVMVSTEKCLGFNVAISFTLPRKK